MKFANYHFAARQLRNVGDNLQLLAVDYIYDQMGVPEKDRIQIPMEELQTYKGEYAVLPVSMPLVDYTPGGLSRRFSPQIIPVFLGLTLMRDFLFPEEISYLLSYSPIGCRDERTMETLQKYRIPCYLNGCISALLPTAQMDRTKLDTAFFVDIPEWLTPHIPQEMMETAEWVSHLRKDPCADPKQEAKDLYDRYINEASVVVTSLLHCATPCMAAGIPVILAKSACSYRFSWLDKLLPIYLPEDIALIDWNPQPVVYGQHKQKLLDNAISQLHMTVAKYAGPFGISAFYEDRNRKPYIVDTFESIKTKLAEVWTPDTTASFAVWGLTQLAELTVHYIQENYPGARLTSVYDRFREEPFMDLVSESPDKISGRPDELVIVTVPSAVDEAVTYFKKIGKPYDKYAVAEIVI